MPDKEKRIKNSWCLYGGMGWWRGFGKIIKDGRLNSYSRQVVWIKGYENNNEPPFSWNMDYIKRFASLNEAAEEYARYKGLRLNIIKERARERFPSENI